MLTLSADWILAGIATVSAIIALTSLVASRRSQREALKQQRELGKEQLAESRRQSTENIAILREQLRLQLLELRLSHGDEVTPSPEFPAPPAGSVQPGAAEFPAEPMTVLLPEESPYVVGPPILELSRFSGRVAQVADFFGYLLGGQLQSVSLLGARRSGKTSFLFHVSRPSALEPHAGATAARLIPVYVDLQAAGPDAQGFFGCVTRRTKLALQQRAGADILDAASPGHD